MSVAKRASVMREHSTGLVDSKSFLDSSLIFLLPNTVASRGVGRGDGRGRSAKTAKMSGYRKTSTPNFLALFYPSLPSVSGTVPTKLVKKSLLALHCMMTSNKSPPNNLGVNLQAFRSFALHWRRPVGPSRSKC